MLNNDSQDSIDSVDSSPIPPARKQLKEIFDALQDINLKGKIVDQESEQLGLGFSCDVFRARSTAHNNMIVAVKRIRFFLLDDLSFANNLGREVRLWSKLKHPNVLPLLGYFLSGRKAVPNLVSAWMKNGTVVDYLKFRPIDAEVTYRMVLGIASGLEYIHNSQNIVHADLKGSNVLVSDDGRPLLADFGLAVSSSSVSLGATTYHGQKGSLRWMAKELHAFSSNCFEIPQHTTMTDMWAFGMVIVELITLEIPYASIADRMVSTAILGGQLPQEPDHRKFPTTFVFRGLWSMGSECWNIDPLKRPTAIQIHRELREFKFSAALSSGNPPDRNPSSAHNRRKRDTVLEVDSRIAATAVRPITRDNFTPRPLQVELPSFLTGALKNGDSIPVEALIKRTEQKIAAVGEGSYSLMALDIDVGNRSYKQ